MAKIPFLKGYPTIKKAVDKNFPYHIASLMIVDSTEVGYTILIYSNEDGDKYLIVDEQPDLVTVPKKIKIIKSWSVLSVMEVALKYLKKEIL